MLSTGTSTTAAFTADHDHVRGGDVVSFYNSDGTSILVVHGDGGRAVVGMMPLKDKQTDPGAKGLFMVLRASVQDAGDLVCIRVYVYMYACIYMHMCIG